MIYCFSGTGNTRRVARLLADRLHTDVHEFSADELREPSQAVLTSDDQIIIWAFPTYSWGVPPVVRAIMREASLDFPADAIHLCLTTCGDDIGNLARMFRGDALSRGLRGGAVFSVQMPNTYVMMKGFDVDAPEVAEHKINAASPRVDAIAEAILSGCTSPACDMVVKGGMAWAKTAVVYPWFVRYRMNPGGFKADTSACISCGKCARVCPMINIEYDSAGHPSWGDKCALCTACYHACPVHAIGWRDTTRKKGQVKSVKTLR